jgi:glycerophosphoryl diester phosphodiesterase
MPENTLPGFIRAVELGVKTLEMDVVISADGSVVVSHEPWMSSEICTGPKDKTIEKQEEQSLNMYKMSYAEIQSYDCGLKLVEEFPEQKKINAIKPSLKMAVRMIRSFAEDNKYTQPAYNIEIKSEPERYEIYQPAPAKFVELVVAEINRLGIENITTLQSFDLNVLEELNKIKGRNFRISYLVAKGKNASKNLSKLSFKPDVYSPLYTLVTAATIKTCHEAGISVVPWTVNKAEDLAKLKTLGIDGVITDYPDRVK